MGATAFLAIQRRRSLPIIEEGPPLPPPGDDEVTSDRDEEVETVDSPGSVEPIASLSVVCSVELSPGKVFPLYPRSVYVGRRGSYEVYIPDSPVSRDHAELIYQNGEFYIRDLGSKYGTRVNGIAVPADGARLSDGDRIQLGTRTVLEFRRPGI